MFVRGNAGMQMGIKVEAPSSASSNADSSSSAVVKAAELLPCISSHGDKSISAASEQVQEDSTADSKLPQLPPGTQIVLRLLLKLD